MHATALQAIDAASQAQSIGDKEKSSALMRLGHATVDIAVQVKDISIENLTHKVKAIGTLLEAVVKSAAVLGACSPDAPGLAVENSEQLYKIGMQLNHIEKQIVKNVGTFSVDALKKVCAYAYAVDKGSVSSAWEPLWPMTDPYEVPGLEAEAKNLITNLEKAATLKTAVNLGIDAGLFKLAHTLADFVKVAGVQKNITWSFWSDLPKVVQNGKEYANINGKLYARHAIDRMTPAYYGIAAGGVEGRDIPLSIVEHVLKYGQSENGKIVNGAQRIITKLDNIEVILENGIILSVLRK